MESPTVMKEVQNLIGCSAALRRFMSRSTYKCLPFFKVLKKKACVNWDEEVEQAFQNLKEHWGRFSHMVSPATGGPLLAYLAVFDHAVSAACGKR